MFLAKQEVKERSISLGLGQTDTVVCPFCKEDWLQQGKPSLWKPSKSCSITKEHTGVLYHCFRAGCSRGSGFIPGVIDYKQVKTKKFTAQEYNPETVALSKSQIEYLSTSMYMTTAEIRQAGIVFSPERSSYIFPIFNVNGYTVGCVDRDFTGKRVPKAITYWFNDCPKLHFVRTVGTSTLLIVEDIPSCIRAGTYIDSCALLSSNINVEQARHIASYYKDIIIALDNDAFNKAIQLKRKYSFYFNSIMLLHLTKDIKNMTDKEARELLGVSNE